MAACEGTSANHCCVFGGVVCEHLRTDVPGRSIACGLRTELGDWDAVYADPRYQPVRVKVMALKNRGCGPVLCGDWPPAGMTCNTCGAGDPVKVA